MQANNTIIDKFYILLSPIMLPLVCTVIAAAMQCSKLLLYNEGVPDKETIVYLEKQVDCSFCEQPTCKEKMTKV